MNNEMCGCGTEEKTSSAKGIVRINYKEDFELVVELLAGDKPYQLGDEDFRIDFMVMASRYTVGRTGGVCERCAVDGNKVRCFMDGHGLPPGELRAEVKVNTPDPNYADGKRLSVAIAEGTVVLVKDNTRFDGAVVKANIPVVLIDAYQLAKAHGYKGTIDEYYATFTDVGQLKANIKGTLDEMTKAEKLRTTAEKERAKAETERQSNRDRFNTAEGERVKNEQLRQANEGKRQQTENERVSAESNRASAEVERVKAEQQRSSTEQARQTAESQRAKDELARVGSENERAKAETERQTAEEERKRAEEDRQKSRDRFNAAEEERKKAEADRQKNRDRFNTAEDERAKAEQARKTAEKQRQTNEEARTTAETERATAEIEREKRTGEEGISKKIAELNRLPVIKTDTETVELLPNVEYEIHVGTALHLSLAAPTDVEIINEYHGSFDTGTQPPTIVWPADVNWESPLIIDGGRHYEFSIRHTAGKYYGLLLSWKGKEN